MQTYSNDTDSLEVQAVEQRRRIHETVQELRTEVRDRLDVKRNVRDNFLSAAALAGLGGLAFGYRMGGIFRR